MEFRQWEREEFPQYKTLDIAVHADEEGAPHIHRRGVWIAHDAAGREIVGQERALEEMGVQLPCPNKPIGRFNNRKMTYTARCRAHLAEICREHGLKLELKPRKRSKSGLAQIEYKARQEEQKAAEAIQKAAEATQKAAEATQKAKAALKVQKATLKATEDARRVLDDLCNKTTIIRDLKDELTRMAIDATIAEREAIAQQAAEYVGHSLQAFIDDAKDLEEPEL